jgi:hypothetical protein
MAHALPRRALGAAALLLAALALIAPRVAHAKIDCDLQPTAPICNPTDPPGTVTGTGTGGGTQSGPPTVFTTTKTDEFGPGQFMSTTTTVDRVQMTMNSTVRTWTTNWLWGFHGCVEFDLLDAAGHSFLHSQKPCFGVDGTAIGTSDRTDSIQWHLHPNDAAAIRSVRITQSLM